MFAMKEDQAERGNDERKISFVGSTHRVDENKIANIFRNELYPALKSCIGTGVT